MIEKREQRVQENFFQLRLFHITIQQSNLVVENPWQLNIKIKTVLWLK